MLARRVSGGRVWLGLGLGWSKDEHDAMGVPLKQRGARADEFLAVRKAMWTTDPAEFKGMSYTSWNMEI
jgi:alkanesulfonate monooxygenase SsuD/methylene tetrahydromethanopterin reductase-like flavin-dependent oxidoreductase (luciferase family)